MTPEARAKRLKDAAKSLDACRDEYQQAECCRLNDAIEHLHRAAVDMLSALGVEPEEQRESHLADFDGSHAPARETGAPIPGLTIDCGPFIGEALRQGRISCYMGLREFAEQFNLPPSRYLDIERTGVATDEEWKRIAIALRIAREKRQEWVIAELCRLKNQSDALTAAAAALTEAAGEGAEGGK